MFSFHRPKIYRSSLGCCICKAKSSSSRFTDSKKYEPEFERCFRIEQKRSGEICNACVLLVKRWKKLSPENRLTKHWNHVVDARAGPGTKLNTNRRSLNSSNNIGHNSTPTGSKSDPPTQRQKHQHSEQSKFDVSPLSSSQSSNQASTIGAAPFASGSASCSSHVPSSSGQHLATPNKRTNSLSKALAIDTNVSTFTFGEPRRRTYGDSYNPYSNTHLYAASSYASTGAFSSSSTFSKPQSALSSSAFESVMKRFRQRQEQQQLQAHRRHQRLQSRSQRQESSQVMTNKTKINSNDFEKNNKRPETSTEPCQSQTSFRAKVNSSPRKRQHRSSESSLVAQSLDGFKVSTILDSSMWKREKTCCGIIFRGINKEIAIFPKLFKPCQLNSHKLTTETEFVAGMGGVEGSERSEQGPRATKSGSVSSCDSNTSGTGSMEGSNFDQPVEQQTARTASGQLAGCRVEAEPRQISKSRGRTQAEPQAPQEQIGNIPAIVLTRSQRGRSTKIRQAPPDSSLANLSNRFILKCTENGPDEDDDEGDEPEIVDNDDDDDDEDEDEQEPDDDELVDDEELDEGSVMTGPADGGSGSELGAGSSLMVDEESENSSDARSSVDSLVGQKAAVG